MGVSNECAMLSRASFRDNMLSAPRESMLDRHAAVMTVQHAFAGC